MATAKKQQSTEVAVPQTHANAMMAFSDDRPDYLKAGGPARGSEEVTNKDLVLPRIEIVQSQSPIKEENPDAREGMLFNSATSELIGDLAYFIPVYFRVEYLVWKDQDEGGGFFGSFPSEREAKDRVRELVADGEREEFLEIVDTPVHFGLMVDPTGANPPQQIVVSMAKSKAKVSRKWNSMIQIAGGDRFSRVYKLTTFTDENKKGQKFKNFVVSPAGFPPEPLYRLAEQTYELFKAQGVKADHESNTIDAESAAPGTHDTSI